VCVANQITGAVLCFRGPERPIVRMRAERVPSTAQLPQTQDCQRKLKYSADIIITTANPCFIFRKEIFEW